MAAVSHSGLWPELHSLRFISPLPRVLSWTPTLLSIWTGPLTSQRRPRILMLYLNQVSPSPGSIGKSSAGVDSLLQQDKA